MTALIIPTFSCRLCRRSVSPAFVASLAWANPANGYLCENCIVREQENMHRLQAMSTEFNSKDVYIDIDGIAPPCAICDTIEGSDRVIEDLDGQKAFLCKPCGAKYLVANRAKIAHTRLEWDLKLK
jgi:hypothetical protein